MNPAAGNPNGMASAELWVTLLKSAAMLSLVLAVLIGVLFLIRRLLYGNGRISGREMIRTIASSHVAPKERIVLVEVLGEMLLLGVTPHTINCLAKFPTDGRPEIPEAPSPDRFFPDFFKKALSGRHRRDERNTDG